MAVVLTVYCHSYDEDWLCWMLSYQLAACFLSCPILRCILSSFLLMKESCKSISDLWFSFSYLKYPSHVWRRFPSSTGMLVIICAIVVCYPILVFPSFAVCASFPYSSSNWVVGCLLLLWRCTYHCLAVTVWRSGARHCESANLRNCKSVSLVCEICCWKIQYCAWFGLEDVSLAYGKCVAMAASPVVFQLLCSTLWPRLVSVLLCAV